MRIPSRPAFLRSREEPCRTEFSTPDAFIDPHADPRLNRALVVLTALAPPTARAQESFREVPGAHLFSGQMILRPIQAGDWRARGVSTAEANARLAAAGAGLRLPVKKEIPQTGEFIVQVPPGRDENEVSATLMATGLFQYAQPDWIVFPASCPNDPALNQQWHHDADQMQSCDAWDLHTGSPAVVIGLVDTGVLVTHQDLLLNRRNGYNAISNLWESQGGDISPLNPHGTATTRMAAANGNNGVGGSGVGWNLGHRMLRPLIGRWGVMAPISWSVPGCPPRRVTRS